MSGFINVPTMSELNLAMPFMAKLFMIILAHQYHCQATALCLLWGLLRTMVLMVMEVAMSGFLNIPTMPGPRLVPTLMEKLLLMNLGGQFLCQVMALC
jgi:hypothetical protein